MRLGGGSAEAVRAGEPRREQADEKGRGEADDVQVVAFDALDEARAEPLDRIRARTAFPLARREVVGEVARRQLPERDARRLGRELLPLRGAQAETRDDLV